MPQIITQSDVDNAKAEFSTLWSKYLDMTRNQAVHTQDQVVAAYQAALAAQARADDLASRVGQAAPTTAVTPEIAETMSVVAEEPAPATRSVVNSAPAQHEADTLTLEEVDDQSAAADDVV